MLEGAQIPIVNRFFLCVAKIHPALNLIISALFLTKKAFRSCGFEKQNGVN